MNMRIGILTYTFTHRKTYDTLCLLRAKGYEDVVVLTQQPRYQKKFQPLIEHRPGLVYSIPDIEELCSNFRYGYEELDFGKDYGKDIVFLVCGAGILPDEFIKKYTVINSHPGYIPYARGLDSFKWSIYEGLPVGVTTHIIGEYVDGGEIIERRKVDIREYDTFHAAAQRVYENEIDMLVGALKKLDEPHEYVVPENGLFKRMPHDKEERLFEIFEKRKKALTKK